MAKIIDWVLQNELQIYIFKRIMLKVLTKELPNWQGPGPKRQIDDIKWNAKIYFLAQSPIVTQIPCADEMKWNEMKWNEIVYSR